MSEEEKQQPKSYVLIQFADVANVTFTVQLNGVTPYQLLAIAGYFEVMAKNQIIQAENERHQKEQQQALVSPPNKIVVPGRD